MQPTIDKETLHVARKKLMLVNFLNEMKINKYHKW